MNELIEVHPKTDLSVAFTDNAVAALGVQRKRLQEFVQTQLKPGLTRDYAVIPGTNKPSLLKPGAEKLANIFQLGSRIVSMEKDVDPIMQFAMFTCTMELFHIPTGKVICQCQGSANTMEKKQANKDFGFQLNALSKMAQKRAYVGAVIIAVGASDFFSQDMDGAPKSPTTARASVPNATAASSTNLGQGAGDFILPFGRAKGTRLADLTPEELGSLKTWLEEQGELKGAAKQTKDALDEFLGGQ